ncbi:L,D-transpeptidase family protein [Buchananella hordeovulneris]|uniref:L,D-transpeptidase family protein n=1 Tax=Buchananella hordeovulneris TaxID=52770 RepID=UPI0026DB57A0|nr:L,D-transpeptidase [Buchananella hordeovulneris]MDO5080233.1 L,D-transpeptidase [Buchananella hordeovulneris]
MGKSKKALWIGGATAVLLLGGAGAAVAYTSQFAGVALPNVSVAGQSVTGLDGPAISLAVQKRLENAQLDVQIGDERVTVALPDLSPTFDAESLQAEALAGSESVLGRLGSLFGSRDVSVEVKFDQAKLEQLLERIEQAAGPGKREASVEFSPESESFVAQPGQVGQSVDLALVRQALQRAGTSLSSQEVSVQPRQVEPQFTTAEAERLAAQANEMLAQTVVITDGQEDFAADVTQRAAWVSLDSEQGKAVFADAKIRAWVLETARQTNVEPKPGIDNVNAAGKVLVEAKPGVAGYRVNNAEEVAEQVVQALHGGQAFSGDFDYDKIEAQNTQRQVLPGAENDPYPAAAGEKWLEINLGNNTVSGYQGRERVHGPVLIVPGKPGHETVTGLFHVYLQYEKQDMGCTPEWPYCAKDVPWVTYFHGSYAFHGAPWQESFGWSGPNGSHGCVNMPVAEAKWVYEFVEAGTPVVSHR